MIKREGGVLPVASGVLRLPTILMLRKVANDPSPSYLSSAYGTRFSHLTSHYQSGSLALRLSPSSLSESYAITLRRSRIRAIEAANGAVRADAGSGCRTGTSTGRRLRCLCRADQPINDANLLVSKPLDPIHYIPDHSLHTRTILICSSSVRAADGCSARSGSSSSALSCVASDSHSSSGSYSTDTSACHTTAVSTRT